MIRSRRQAFNAAFTEARHRAYVDALVRQCGVPIEFRLSETPCFFPAALIDDLTRRRPRDDRTASWGRGVPAGLGRDRAGSLPHPQRRGAADLRSGGLRPRAHGRPRRGQAGRVAGVPVALRLPDAAGRDVPGVVGHRRRVDLRPWTRSRVVSEHGRPRDHRRARSRRSRAAWRSTPNIRRPGPTSG